MNAYARDPDVKVQPLEDAGTFALFQELETAACFARDCSHLADRTHLLTRIFADVYHGDSVGQNREYVSEVSYLFMGIIGQWMRELSDASQRVETQELRDRGWRRRGSGDAQ